MVSQAEVQWKGTTYVIAVSPVAGKYNWLRWWVCPNKIRFITAIEKTLYRLINTINCTGRFKYTARTIANYLIAFVDRSLFVLAYNQANNFAKKNSRSEWLPLWVAPQNGAGGRNDHINITT